VFPVYSHASNTQEKSSDERSDLGSQGDASDYDVEEEYDNDYVDNYFDNGENDDVEDLGGGGGVDDGKSCRFWCILPDLIVHLHTGGTYD